MPRSAQDKAAAAAAFEKKRQGWNRIKRITEARKAKAANGKGTIPSSCPVVDAWRNNIPAFHGGNSQNGHPPATASSSNTTDSWWKGHDSNGGWPAPSPATAAPKTTMGDGWWNNDGLDSHWQQAPLGTIPSNTMMPNHGQSNDNNASPTQPQPQPQPNSQQARTEAPSSQHNNFAGTASANNTTDSWWKGHDSKGNWQTPNVAAAAPNAPFGGPGWSNNDGSDSHWQQAPLGTTPSNNVMPSPEQSNNTNTFQTQPDLQNNKISASPPQTQTQSDSHNAPFEVPAQEEDTPKHTRKRSVSFAETKQDGVDEPLLSTWILGLNPDAKITLHITTEPRKIATFHVSQSMMTGACSMWEYLCEKYPLFDPDDSSSDASDGSGSDDSYHSCQSDTEIGTSWSYQDQEAIDALHTVLKIIHWGSPPESVSIPTLAYFGEMTSILGAQAVAENQGIKWARQFESEPVRLCDAEYGLFVARRYNKTELWQWLVKRVLLECSYAGAGEWADFEGRRLRHLPETMGDGIREAFDYMEAQRLHIAQNKCPSMA